MSPKSKYMSKMTRFLLQTCLSTGRSLRRQLNRSRRHPSPNWKILLSFLSWSSVSCCCSWHFLSSPVSRRCHPHFLCCLWPNPRRRRCYLGRRSSSCSLWSSAKEFFNNLGQFSKPFPLLRAKSLSRKLILLSLSHSLSLSLSAQLGSKTSVQKFYVLQNP